MKKKKVYFACLILSSLLVVTSCRSSKPSSSKGSSSKSSSSVARLSPDQQKVVQSARYYKGTKYKYGGTSKKGMDCSGLICTSYKEVGITLPRTSADQSNYGKRVYIGELVPGDLVFFGHKPSSKKITHVGMVTKHQGGKITFIHASSSQGVVESDMTSGWWRDRYIKAVRPLEK